MRLSKKEKELFFHLDRTKLGILCTDREGLIALGLVKKGLAYWKSGRLFASKIKEKSARSQELRLLLEEAVEIISEVSSWGPDWKEPQEYLPKALNALKRKGI